MYINQRQVVYLSIFVFTQNPLFSLCLLEMSQISIVVKEEPNQDSHTQLPIQPVHGCLKLKHNPLPPVLLYLLVFPTQGIVPLSLQFNKPGIGN